MSERKRKHFKMKANLLICCESGGHMDISVNTWLTKLWRSALTVIKWPCGFYLYETVFSLQLKSFLEELNVKTHVIHVKWTSLFAEFTKQGRVPAQLLCVHCCLTPPVCFFPVVSIADPAKPQQSCENRISEPITVAVQHHGNKLRINLCSVMWSNIRMIYQKFSLSK